MNLFIDEPELFEDPSVNVPLLGVLDACGEGRHRLIVGADVDLATTGFGKAASAFAPELPRLLAMAQAADPSVPPGTRPGGPHAEIRRDMSKASSARYRLTPAEAARWVHQPLTLVLENHSDMALVRHAIDATNDDVLDTALDRGWVDEVAPGGVAEVAKRLERATANERLFAVCDSDRQVWPANGADPHADLPKDKSGRVIAASSEKNLPVHVWRRREADNYLPTAALEDLVGVDRKPRAQLRSFQRLPETTRWVVDLAKHFAAVPDVKSRLAERLNQLPGHPAWKADSTAIEEFEVLCKLLRRWL